jgi:hypothetical protein
MERAGVRHLRLVLPGPARFRSTTTGDCYGSDDRSVTVGVPYVVTGCAVVTGGGQGGEPASGA